MFFVHNVHGSFAFEELHFVCGLSVEWAFKEVAFPWVIPGPAREPHCRGGITENDKVALRDGAPRGCVIGSALALHGLVYAYLRVTRERGAYKHTKCRTLECEKQRS